MMLSLRPHSKHFSGKTLQKNPKSTKLQTNESTALQQANTDQLQTNVEPFIAVLSNLFTEPQEIQLLDRDFIEKIGSVASQTQSMQERTQAQVKSYQSFVNKKVQKAAGVLNSVSLRKASPEQQEALKSVNAKLQQYTPDGTSIEKIKASLKEIINALAALKPEDNKRLFKFLPSKIDDILLLLGEVNRLSDDEITKRMHWDLGLEIFNSLKSNSLIQEVNLPFSQALWTFLSQGHMQGIRMTTKGRNKWIERDLQS